MTAYYNENDPKAAAWLRELIFDGQIAWGDVDERSIEDVLPSELVGYTQCHFFAGIGGWSYALRLAGWLDDREVWTGSCPCQPANLSARQAKARGLMIVGTFGPPSGGSSTSARLQSSLVSRLQARLASHGSTLFSLTWKVRTTPARRSISALRALGRRTSGSDFGGWPTTTTTLDASNTRNATANRKPGAKKAHAGVTLVDAVTLCGWGTPTTEEAGGTPERFLARKAALNGACGVSLTALNLQAQLASWATTTTRDFRSDRGQMTASELYGSKGQPLARQALYADSGAEPTGSIAETASTGLLNPAHSRWLMGYPAEWDSCGATAMQSSRKSRRRSSERT